LNLPFSEPKWARVLLLDCSLGGPGIPFLHESPCLPPRVLSQKVVQPQLSVFPSLACLNPLLPISSLSFSVKRLLLTPFFFPPGNFYFKSSASAHYASPLRACRFLLAWSAPPSFPPPPTQTFNSPLSYRPPHVPYLGWRSPSLLFR